MENFLEFLGVSSRSAQPESEKKNEADTASTENQGEAKNELDVPLLSIPSQDYVAYVFKQPTPRAPGGPDIPPEMRMSETPKIVHHLSTSYSIKSIPPEELSPDASSSSSPSVEVKTESEEAQSITSTTVQQLKIENALLSERIETLLLAKQELRGQIDKLEQQLLSAERKHQEEMRAFKADGEARAREAIAREQGIARRLQDENAALLLQQAYDRNRYQAAERRAEAREAEIARTAADKVATENAFAQSSSSGSKTMQSHSQKVNEDVRNSGL
jgi:hypothetical protein